MPAGLLSCVVTPIVKPVLHMGRACHSNSASCTPQVSLSSAVMPMVKMVPRGFTAAADAYLTPHILR